MSTLRAEIDRVVAAGNCSGCGACLLLDRGLELVLGDDGFARPEQVGPSQAGPRAALEFRRSCPGSVVSAAHAPLVERHPTMGPVVAAWRAWASDDELRYAGSSGGTLTALAAWLNESGRAARVIGVTPDERDARRTVSVSITTREQALAASGSRYAPVTGTFPALGGATIGTPCRVSGMRALGAQPGHAELRDEILLSFFCAGTPSQRATDHLVSSLGSDDAPEGLRYRGNGWPGRFTVTTGDGSMVSLSYDQSWGEHLGRQLHPRCKLCPDGVGESADISAADLWESDDRGYPVFTPGSGTSALIARTPRGYELVLEAVAAGVLVVQPVRIERVAAVQPLHVERRSTLAGRMLGAALAGRRLPRYRGFGLVALGLGRWRDSVRAARGSWRRTRSRA